MSNETVVTLVPTPGDDVYLSLGRAIAGLCPSGFAEAKLDADLSGASATMKIVCTPEGGAEIQITIDPFSHRDIEDLLKLIRDKSIGENQRLWRSCTVILRKGGRFQMDVHY